MQTEEASSDRTVNSPAPTSGMKGAPLADILANSKWSYGKDPFPHILVEQVFMIPPIARFWPHFVRRIRAATPAGPNLRASYITRAILMPT